jgi:hypothetical protein
MKIFPEISVYMQPSEVSLIQSHLNSRDDVLEWGAGGSTLYFSQFVLRYFSIEHDSKWYSKLVKIGIPKNVELFFIPQNAARSDPTRREEFQNYIEIIHKLPLSHYDKVIIDGRARIYCAEEVLPFLKPDSIVFFHDFQRPRYRSVLEFYDLIKEIKGPQGLAVLRKKR